MPSKCKALNLIIGTEKKRGADAYKMLRIPSTQLNTLHGLFLKTLWVQNPQCVLGLGMVNLQNLVTALNLE